MSSNRFSTFFKEYPTVANLIAINLIFWCASIFLPEKTGFDVVKFLGMHYWSSDLFNPLQMISYMFLHNTGSFAHLFFNMFGVYMFGRILEQVWGTKKFLFYYLLTGFGAAIIQQLFWTIDLAGVTSALNTAIATNSGKTLVPFQHLFQRWFTGDISQITAIDAIWLKEMLLNAPVTIGASGFGRRGSRGCVTQRSCYYRCFRGFIRAAFGFRLDVSRHSNSLFCLFPCP